MPDLTIIAGCNGAGKSTFSKSFLSPEESSFDYDKRFKEIYIQMMDSEFREKFAKDQTTKEFESAVEIAINNQENFSYETNFDAHPIYWAEKFKQKGYHINLIFFCLKNQEIAKHRVHVRAEFKGHYVDNETIDLKWKAGYQNLNRHFEFFDNILIVDNSINNQIYSNILHIIKGKPILLTDKLPEYFQHRLPEIYHKLFNEDS